MRDALGVSIGTTNLVAVPSTGAPLVRRAILTLYPHRPPEVGVPSENPSLTEQGLVLAGFVDRVGDPVPVVAGDGTTYRGEQLVADAVEALTRSTNSRGPQPRCAAVPSHWRATVVEALRGVIANRPALSSLGQPLPVMSDAVAALTALQAQPGLPARGIVALCDFGATGTSITMADAGANFRSVAPTVRHDEFSGDLIDQAMLRQVLAELDVDQSNTTAVAALGHVREQCRIAKEQLSRQTATGFTAPLPGPQSTVRLTRAELEMLLRDPLDGVIGAIEETLQRNNIARADLVAVATAGGCASIPLVTQRLSETFRIAVTTSPRPQTIAALGASLIAQRGPEDDAVTELAMAPSAVALTAAHTVPGPAAVEPLAWSEDESIDDIATAAPTDYDVGPADAWPGVTFGHAEGSAMEALPPLQWYRRPGVLFVAAAFVALLATVGLVLTSRIGALSTPTGTTGTTTTTASAEVPPLPPTQAPPPASETVVERPSIPPPRQPTPAPRPAPPPPSGPPPMPTTAVVTSTTVVTATSTTPTTTEPSPECAPPNCITVPEPDPDNCGVTGECPDPDPDPVVTDPGPDPNNCGYTGECGPSPSGGGGGTTPDGGNPGGGGDPITELCPADLPEGHVC